MKNSIRLMIILISILVFSFSCNENKEIKSKTNDDIAKLYLVSYDGKSESKYFIRSLGHTFIILENITNEDIVLYNYIIKANESITFSWWAIDKHMGIWFNIESNYINKYNRYDERYSITQYIACSDLETINGYMKENDNYSPLNNCAKRCTELWNLCAEKEEVIDKSLINNPTNVCKEIKKFIGYERNIIVPFIDKIYYYNEFLEEYEME